MSAEPHSDEYVDHNEYDVEDEEPDFDCPMFWVSGTRQKHGFWHCPLAGSEECDWECPYS